MEWLTIEYLAFFSTFLNVVVGGFAYKFIRLYLDIKALNKATSLQELDLTLKEQEVITKLGSDIRSELRADMLSLRKEVEKYKRENIELRKELAEEKIKSSQHQLLLETYNKQIQKLEKELRRVRKRLAAAQSKKPCNKCNDPEECAFGLDCYYE